MKALHPPSSSSSSSSFQSKGGCSFGTTITNSILESGMMRSTLKAFWADPEEKETEKTQKEEVRKE